MTVGPGGHGGGGVRPPTAIQRGLRPDMDHIVFFVVESDPPPRFSAD